MANGYKSIEKFLTDLTLEASGPSYEKDAITISTVHSAKGLEFKVVFIMDCVDGSFPCIRKATADTPKAKENAFAEFEEERRVLYVALTRAKYDLYIMWPEFISKFGSTEKATLSCFLKDWLSYDEESHELAEVIVEEDPKASYPYNDYSFMPY